MHSVASPVPSAFPTAQLSTPQQPCGQPDTPPPPPPTAAQAAQLTFVTCTPSLPNCTSTCIVGSQAPVFLICTAWAPCSTSCTILPTGVRAGSKSQRRERKPEEPSCHGTREAEGARGSWEGAWRPHVSPSWATAVYRPPVWAAQSYSIIFCRAGDMCYFAYICQNMEYWSLTYKPNNPTHWKCRVCLLIYVSLNPLAASSFPLSQLAEQTCRQKASCDHSL